MNTGCGSGRAGLQVTDGAGTTAVICDGATGAAGPTGPAGPAASSSPTANIAYIQGTFNSPTTAEVASFSLSPGVYFVQAIVTAQHGTSATTTIKVSCSLSDDATLMPPVNSGVALGLSNNPTMSEYGSMAMAGYLNIPATLAGDTLRVRCASSSDIKLNGSSMVVMPLSAATFSIANVAPSGGTPVSIGWNIAQQD